MGEEGSAAARAEGLSGARVSGGGRGPRGGMLGGGVARERGWEMIQIILFIGFDWVNEWVYSVMRTVGFDGTLSLSAI
jgi:hypothetical protein